MIRKDTQINIRISTELKEQVKLAAEKQRTNASDFITEAIKKALKRCK